MRPPRYMALDNKSMDACLAAIEIYNKPVFWYLEQPELRQSVKGDQSWFERAEEASVNTKSEGDAYVGPPVDPT